MTCLVPTDQTSFGFEVSQGALIFEAKGLPSLGGNAAEEKAEQVEKKSLPIAISLRYGWDGKDEGALGARLAAYGEAGIQHVLVEPAERALEDWLRAVERIARAAEEIKG